MSSGEVQEAMFEANRKREMFKKVLAEVTVLDPEGLIAMGAPADEYLGEANVYAQLITDSEFPPTPEEVKEVWAGSFSGLKAKYPALDLKLEELTRRLVTIHREWRK
jgi:hypothetical protein